MQGYFLLCFTIDFLNNFVLVTGKIADMYTKLIASRSYVYAVARACDRGHVSRRVSTIYLFSACLVLKIPLPGLRWSHSILIRKSGGGGVGRYAMFRWQRLHQWCVHLYCGEFATQATAEYPMGRFLRDSRLYTVGAGTQEIRRMLIGREFNQDFKS
jgi:isovaleryl-CoA dehydrogenase